MYIRATVRTSDLKSYLLRVCVLLLFHFIREIIPFLVYIKLDKRLPSFLFIDFNFAECIHTMSNVHVYFHLMSPQNQFTSRRSSSFSFSISAYFFLDKQKKMPYLVSVCTPYRLTLAFVYMCVACRCYVCVCAHRLVITEHLAVGLNKSTDINEYLTRSVWTIFILFDYELWLCARAISARYDFIWLGSILCHFW